jgi:hypothetical protein
MSIYNRLKNSFTLTSLILTTSIITACSNQGNQSQVSIDGAAVGFPISLAVAEEYHRVEPNAVVSVASSGTGGDSPRGSLNFKTLYAVGAVLFLITLTLNIISYWISNRFKEKYD